MKKTLCWHISTKSLQILTKLFTNFDNCLWLFCLQEHLMWFLAVIFGGFNLQLFHFTAIIIHIPFNTNQISAVFVRSHSVYWRIESQPWCDLHHWYYHTLLYRLIIFNRTIIMTVTYTGQVSNCFVISFVLEKFREGVVTQIRNLL